MTDTTQTTPSFSPLTKTQKNYVDAIVQYADECGVSLSKATYSRAELRLISMKVKGKIWIPNWITHDQGRRAGRGLFLIPEVAEAARQSMPVPPPMNTTTEDQDAPAVMEAITS